jgi:ornithine carbamoyltransferase
VINALTDLHHPCQALAFCQTLFERRDKKDRQHVVFVGDSNNVCNSIMILMAKLGHDFTVASPKGYEPRQKILSIAGELAKASGSRISILNEPSGAVSKATAIYTDVWTSMGQEKELEQRNKDFAGFQVNDRLLTHAPKDVLVSHCLPAHRGEEISSSVLDSENSIAFDEAENRLHVQKAVIVHLFS